jgi:hypothetical protein
VLGKAQPCWRVFLSRSRSCMVIRRLYSFVSFFTEHSRSASKTNTCLDSWIVLLVDRERLGGSARLAELRTFERATRVPFPSSQNARRSDAFSASPVVRKPGQQLLLSGRKDGGSLLVDDSQGVDGAVSSAPGSSPSTTGRNGRTRIQTSQAASAGDAIRDSPPRRRSSSRAGWP